MLNTIQQRLVAIAICVFLSIILVAGSAGMINAAPALAPADERATHIVIKKGARTMSLLRGDSVVKTYRVALGGDPVGAKKREGDSRTPEGRYTIDFKNKASRYHLSLRISYPDASDRKRASAANVPPGSDIMIHGLPNGFGWLGATHRDDDWTDGCIAVTNEEIEEIWSRVETGTTIEIRP